MTAHDPRVTLTEAEVERIADCQNGLRVTSGLFAVIADVIADRVDARLAPIRALAERWAVLANGTGDAAWAYAGIADDLRAALDAPVSASQDHDGAVHNHPPYEPTCNERRVDGQLRGACLNDDGSPQ